MRWKHTHKMGVPRNSTACTKDYDPTLWQASCRECGHKEMIPVGHVREVRGGLSIIPPKGWE